MKRKLFSFTLTLLLSLWTAMAQVTVSGSASGNGSYTTLGAAITAIPLIGQSGNNITIEITASTTEGTTGITIGAGNWTSLKIYPTASSIIVQPATSTNITPFITLSGANNVTIDGRLNQTGASSLTLINVTSSSGTAGSTILFDNNAQNNAIKYCTLKGNQTGNFGIVSFSATATVTNGNGLNIVDHNIITHNGTPPKYAIYAIGNTSFPNIGNQITNNEFKDLLSIYLASTTVFIAGGTSAAQNDNFTISGNSFYQTATIDDYASSNLGKIMIGIGTSAAAFGGSHTINDNYFGGTVANCGGTALTKRYKEATLHVMAIYPSGGTTSIQNNTIKNISWSNDYFPASMTGINIAGGTGNVNIGTVTGNTIGDNTSTGSFIFIAKGTANVSATLIGISTTGTVNCQNNKIGSFTAQDQTTGQYIGVTAISKSAGAGTTNISNNIIGSLTTANSIYSYNTVGIAAGQNVTGISCSGTGICTINNNTIANLTNNTTTGYLYGINMGGATTSGTANGNLIHSNVIIGYTGTSANIGINSGAGTNTISNNIIRLGDNNACEIRGINDGTGATSTSSYHNTIYISGSPTSGAFNSYCEFSSGPATIKYYKNNIFVNARSNNGATGSHYALYLNTTNTGTLGVDGNDYYVSGTGGVLGRYSTDMLTLTDLKTATGQDASSVNYNPTFANAAGTNATDYIPSDMYKGVSGTGVTTDYAGTIRFVQSIGAFEVTNFTALNNSRTSDIQFLLSKSGQFELIGIEVGAGNIYSSQGKLLKSFNTNTFSINNLPKGVYMLTATDKNGNSFSEKFINQ